MLRTISRPSKALTSPKKRWWTSQKRPITAKLSAKAKKLSHCSPMAAAIFAAGEVLGHVEAEHQQRDRDREDPVAEGDDPRELDLVPLAPLRLPLLGHPGIIVPGRDGTATRSS